MKKLFFLMPAIFLASGAHAWHDLGVLTPVSGNNYRCVGTSDWCLRSADGLDSSPSVGDKVIYNLNGKEVDGGTIINIIHSDSGEPAEEVSLPSDGRYEYELSGPDTE
jgi:hypothetical protein